MLVCLEGAPGAGKASLARCLAANGGFTSCPYQAPVADLTDLQMEEQRWAFYTQLRILLDRVRVLEAAAPFSSQEGAHAVMVGSPASDALCHAAGARMPDAEEAVYRAWTERLTAALPAHAHVLVTTPLEAAFASVVHRGRREQSHMGLDQLENLRQRYARQFAGCQTVHLPSGSADNDVMLQGAAREIADAV